VGETTYRATAETIDYSEAPAVEAKGKEAPIPVWEVVQARARFGVDLTPEARTPLVGRKAEVEQLVQCARTGPAAAFDGAGHGRRRAGYRQEQAGRGAVSVDRARRTTDVLAAGDDLCRTDRASAIGPLPRW